MGNSSSSTRTSSSRSIRSSLTEVQKKELDNQLIKAATEGDLETTKKLIQQGADVNAADNTGRSALNEASFTGHTATARLLIDNGANVNAVGFFGVTALHFASLNGHTETANLLLQNGANIYLERQYLSNISDLVLSLRQAHKDLKAICLSDENNQVGAVLDGKIDRIKSELLAKYPNLINSPLDEEGNTILNLIADKIVYKEEGREKDGLLRLFAKLAINSSEFKRNVTTNIVAGITADYSTDNKKGGNNPIDELLVINNSLKRKNLNLDINDQNLIKAFFLAVKQGLWQDAVKHYSQSSSLSLGQNTAGGSASSSSSSSFTAGSSNNNAARSGKGEKYPDTNLPASSSSSSSSSSSVRSLLTEAQKQEFDNQLIKAAREGVLETIRNLVQQGADINAKDNKGWTALHSSSFDGKTAAATFLIDNGANVNAVNNNGRTALHLASLNGHAESARLLIDKGANVNAADSNGWTALYTASYKGHTETAALLLQNGANVYLEVQDLSKISDLVLSLTKAHEALKAICLSDGNNKGEIDVDGKINRIRSELLAKYPNLINSHLDDEGNTILNLIANKIVSQEEGKEKDNLLWLFVKLAINSSEFKRNVTTNIVAGITADYSTDNKKGGNNPIDELLVINNSLKRKNLNLDINDQNLIKAFFLAVKQGLWQDAVKHYSQASSSDLGQNTAGGSASSSSSSSFTADSSNNNAARSGKDEAFPDDATLSAPSSTPSDPEGKGASGNKGGQEK